MSNTADGLRGVVVGDTTVCTVGEGHDLFYRGYDIIELAKKARFEEIIHLLLRGSLPTKKELEQLKNKLIHLRQLPESVRKALELIPKTAHPMSVMQIGTNMLAVEYPEKDFSQQEDISYRLLAALPSVMCYWYRFVTDKIRIDTTIPDVDSISAHILHMLHDRKPTAAEVKALDITLVLYAEHEMNASTFTCRVVSATLSDFYSTISAGIAALKGPLHGGANEAVMELLSRFKDPEEAIKSVKDMLVHKEKIMGFGHAVYKTRDPRNVVIKELARNLSLNHKDKIKYHIAEAIEQLMWDEKKLFPNLDFYSACSYRFLDVPTSLFTPIFVCSRVSGWASHIFEQRANNKLIRPSANYIGKDDQKWVDLEDRG